MSIVAPTKLPNDQTFQFTNSCEARPSEFCRVDLRALELAAEVGVDGFPLREDLEGRRPGLAMAVAGGLRAAERQVDFGADRWGVDVEDARVDIAHDRKGAVDILRVDRRRETVLHAVGDGDRFLDRLASHDADDRTEDLLPGNAHLRRHVREYRRFVEEALGVRPR